MIRFYGPFMFAGFNNVADQFERIKSKFRLIQHLLVLKLKRKTTNVLQKVLKVAISSFQAQRCALDDIPTKFPDCIPAISFDEISHALN